MADTQIVNLDTQVRRNLRHTRPGQTFRLAFEQITAAAVAPIDPVIEDFLEVACAIFFADSSFRRGSDTRPEMGTAWHRRFHIKVPVQALDRWSDPAVVDALSEAAQFLTDDSFSFEFVAREPRLGRQNILDLDPTGVTFQAEEVILFSGGLDSFAGALEALSTIQGNVLLVSHRSAQKVKSRQDRLAEYLLNRFRHRLMYVKVDAHRVSTAARDTTQRSRTFLFAALGHAVAQSFGARRISFYENGIVSHNLPIGPQVIGTMATRTTHPLALHMLNRLLGLLRPGVPPISNGYAWLTKTEVVQRIAQYGAEDQIRRAVSCTSVRDQTTLNPHCGTCSQCLDRRFGILAAGLEKHDPADGYKSDVLLGTRTGHQATMAVEWSRHALHMARVTPMDLISRFGPHINRILAGHPTLSADHAMQMMLAMHQRHAAAVKSVLTRAVCDNAPEIVAGSLPTNSLLMMHIGAPGGGAPLSIPPDPRLGEKRPAMPTYIPEIDRRVDPDAPLEVSFFFEGEHHRVSVKGLCDILGIQAKVAHGLKPMFDEDRKDGLEPDQHRYMMDYRKLGLDLSSSAVRKHIQLCRKTLAASYEQLFGVVPRDHLLIQNKPRHGYRLDPSIRLTARNQNGEIANR
jgi:7-cyano-7-deazaguanine synthase in queuosine biosynthesis